MMFKLCPLSRDDWQPSILYLIKESEKNDNLNIPHKKFHIWNHGSLKHQVLVLDFLLIIPKIDF